MPFESVVTDVVVTGVVSVWCQWDRTQEGGTTGVVFGIAAHLHLPVFQALPQYDLRLL